MSASENRKRQRLGRRPLRRELPFVEKLLAETLDVDTFLYVFHAFEAAASRRMPMKLGARTTSSGQDGAIYLTDLPVNRGMKAAFDEIKSLGVSEQTRMASLRRVMDASQFYDHLDRLGDSVKPSACGKALMLSDAVVKALAVVSYDVDRYDAKISVDDLLEHAARFRDGDQGTLSPPLVEQADAAIPSANDRSKPT